MKIVIIGLLKLSLGKSKAKAGETQEQLKSAAEMKLLEGLAGDKCLYTTDYDNKGSKDIVSAGDGKVEYRAMTEEYLKMFKTTVKRLECEEEGKKVIELQYLCENVGAGEGKGPAHPFKDKSPGKWLDYVIFYALEKRLVKIEDNNLFIGIALYSQKYPLEDAYKEIFLDNMIELFAQSSIEKSKYGFYRTVYTKNGKDLRDEQALFLLEELMKAMLLKLLDILNIPFGIEIRGGQPCLRIYERFPESLDEFFKKRASRLAGVNEQVTFKHVIMERIPSNSSEKFYIHYWYRRIFLMLIGAIRSGRHVISSNCKHWLDVGIISQLYGTSRFYIPKNYGFKRFLRLVSPNQNLVGLTELNSSLDLASMLGGIKGQLTYLEINFGFETSKYAKAIKFIKSLNGVKLKTSMYYGALNAKVLGVLLESPGVRLISSLRIMDVYDRLKNTNDLNMLKAVANNPKVARLELYNCRMSLEKFLLREDFGVLKNKLFVLEVPGLGNLRNEAITDESLKSLKLERLHIIDVHGYKEEEMDLEQLVDRGIITRKSFRYLVFKKMVDLQGVVNLRYKLGAGWPLIVTSFKPPGVANEDYTCISNELRYYEIRVRRQ